MEKLKKIKPLFNRILTTAETYKEDQFTAGGIISEGGKKGDLKMYQRVLAVGDTVRGISVGDLVMINPERYAMHKYKKGDINDQTQEYNQVLYYHFESYEVDGKPCLLLYDSDVKFIIEEMIDSKIEALKTSIETISAI